MVERIDECLSYLKAHVRPSCYSFITPRSPRFSRADSLSFSVEQRDFRDAELYIIRYQQCQTRSMTLIKMYFLTQVKLLGQDVARRMADRVSLFFPLSLRRVSFSPFSQSLSSSEPRRRRSSRSSLHQTYPPRTTSSIPDPRTRASLLVDESQRCSVSSWSGRSRRSRSSAGRVPLCMDSDEAGDAAGSSDERGGKAEPCEGASRRVGQFESRGSVNSRVELTFLFCSFTDPSRMWISQATLLR